jgi:hypothetical protein
MSISPHPNRPKVSAIRIEHTLFIAPLNDPETCCFRVPAVILCQKPFYAPSFNVRTLTNKKRFDAPSTLQRLSAKLPQLSTWWNEVTTFMAKAKASGTLKSRP